MAQDYLCNMERQAIEETRQAFAIALQQVGALDAVRGLTAAQVDAILETVWKSIRGSMHRQSVVEGEVPF